ncbi:DNA-directed RNA polymerase [Acetivibrio straminisolvens JCM 21531]|uniref:DNA-directed RNA polymerase n=1 Tax=Acetivibrio straminisolvens JCM 21531 TaxID=1294263 RepID=W4V2I0_9FIRM|nr:DNA-directed RNA polymerase [Acetivibrio straminisolvens JCM 21531]
MAYDNGEIELHSKIKVRMKKVIDGIEKSKIIETTLGRLIFNEAIPQDLGFVDRSNPDNIFDLEVDFLVGKNELRKIIDKSIKVHGTTETAILLDRIKALGFRFSTKGAITISVSDMVIPEVKARYIKETEEKIEKITKQYKRGLISDEERYNSVIAAWTEASENITQALISNLDRFNPVYMMSQSGARGNINQIKQLAGMRGLMADTSGKTIEVPIKANFREGLNVMEFFISTHGARKGLADTALRTATRVI